MNSTTRITVSVPTEMAVLLEAEAKASDRTASAIVRRALRAVLPSQFESPPLGGQGHATLPGTPATAAAGLVPIRSGGGTFLDSSSPPGEVRVSPMPGLPTDAAGRGLGRSSLEALPGSTFHQETIMTADPHKTMKDEDVARVRRLQRRHGDRQCYNQDSRNTEAKSPAPTVYQPAPGEPR
jgi:Ribbon-helix-helix protein, copG family